MLLPPGERRRGLRRQAGKRAEVGEPSWSGLRDLRLLCLIFFCLCAREEGPGVKLHAVASWCKCPRERLGPSPFTLGRKPCFFSRKSPFSPPLSPLCRAMSGRFCQISSLQRLEEVGQERSFPKMYYTIGLQASREACWPCQVASLN